MIQHVSVAIIGLAVAVGCAPSEQREGPTDESDATPNTLSESEVTEGWELLFDGESLDGWRGFKTEQAPSSWKVVDGTLHFSPDGQRGDIVSDRQFENFELSLEWKISPAGNSGIFYRVSEEAESIWEAAPEMQVLDNEGHPDGQYPTHTAGGNYDLHAPPADVTRAIGEWNAVRIIVNGNHVEHWLNGTKVVEYEFGSPEWTSLVAASKFSEFAGYGMSRRGHIALQDHDDEVWYRNIKIRELPSAP